MSNHTQGIWEIEPIECVGRGEELGKADIVVWDDDREGYEIVFKAVDFDDEKSKANAIITTSAPDLLEALIRARDDLNNAKFLIRKELGEHHWLSGIEKGMKVADAAIAKARGES